MGMKLPVKSGKAILTASGIKTMKANSCRKSRFPFGKKPDCLIRPQTRTDSKFLSHFCLPDALNSRTQGGGSGIHGFQQSGIYPGFLTGLFIGLLSFAPAAAQRHITFRC